MAREAKVGVKLETSKTKSDVLALGAAIKGMTSSFEKSNVSAKKTQGILRDIQKDLKSTSNAKKALTQATIREKSARTASFKALESLRLETARQKKETQSLTSAKVALVNQNIKVKSTEEALKNARTQNVQALTKQREANTALINKRKEMLGQSSKLNSSAKASVGIFGQLSKVLAMLGASVALRSSVRTLTDFEFTMARVNAITQATDQQFTELTNTARQLGATTQYTASQAAQGMKYLGLVGLDTNEVISTIPDVLNLATAAAMDMGSAADIVAKTMTSFNISATDTTRISDVLVQTMTNANTDVMQFGQALKFVGPVAQSANISLEQTASAIGAISNSGIQASIAGTGLRRVIQALLNPTKKAVKAFKTMGLSVDDINPQLVDFETIVMRLSEAGLGQIPELAFQAFGLRGAPVIQALVNNIDDFEHLIQLNDDAKGRAQEVADVLDNTLRASFKRLTSAMQEFVLASGDNGVLYVLRGITETSASVVRSLAGIATETERASVVIQGFSAIIRGLALAGLAKGLVKIGVALKTIAVGTGAAAVGGPATIFIGIAAAIGIALPAIGSVVKALSNVSDVTDEYIEKTKEISNLALEVDDNLFAMSSSVTDLGENFEGINVDSLTESLVGFSNAAIKASKSTDNLSKRSENMKSFSEIYTGASGEVKKASESLKQASEEFSKHERSGYFLRKVKEAQDDLKDSTSDSRAEGELLLDMFIDLNSIDLSHLKSQIDSLDLSKLSIDFLPETPAGLTKEEGDSLNGTGQWQKFMTTGGPGATAEGSMAERIFSQLNKMLEESSKRDRIAINAAKAQLEGLKTKFMPGYAAKGEVEQLEETRKELLKALGGVIPAKEVNQAIDAAIKSITDKASKGLKSASNKIARDRARLLKKIGKVITPEYDIKKEDITKTATDALKANIAAEKVATYERMALRDLDEKDLKDYVTNVIAEFKLQERAGVISKGMAIEGLRTLFPEVKKGSELWLKIIEAIKKYNKAMDKDVESRKKDKMGWINEALAEIQAEFETSKFEILSGEDMELYRAFLVELQGRADVTAKQYKKIQRVIDGLKDSTNLAKEATQEWTTDIENGFVQAIMGAESFSDAMSNVIAKMAEFLIQQALFGGGGLAEGKIGGLIGSIFGTGRANGGPVSKNRAYVVGERRPEVFVPKTAGTIIPSTGMGGNVFNTNVSVNVETTGDLTEDEAQRVGVIVAGIIDEKNASFMQRQQRSGGMLNRPYTGVNM